MSLSLLCELGEKISSGNSPVFGLVYRITKNYHDTEDVMQQALLKARLYLDKYDSSRSFGSWFSAIALNEARGFVVMRNRSRKICGTYEVARPEESIERSPLEASSIDELNTKIAEHLKKLPKERRDVFYLTVVKGMKCREVAQFLGIPVGTVKSRAHQARIDLRDPSQQAA